MFSIRQNSAQDGLEREWHKEKITRFFSTVYQSTNSAIPSHIGRTYTFNNDIFHEHVLNMPLNLPPIDC